MTVANPAVVLDLDDSFLQDPYPVYQTLRRHGPVHAVRLPDGARGWLIVDYHLARHLLNDPRLSKNVSTPLGRAALANSQSKSPADNILSQSMLFSDPPSHTRLRALIQPAFGSGAIRRLRPRIGEIADALLDDLDLSDVIDLIDSFAFPLPVWVICELLGVPREDQDVFRDWSMTFTDATKGPEQRLQAGRQFAAYLKDLVDERIVEPADDLLSALIAASADGDQLSHKELLATAVLLIVAGHETTTTLIGSAAAQLLTHPGLLAQLRDDPDLTPGFLEEVLRHDSPIHLATLRFSAEPMTLAGHRIGAGEMIYISIAAANRDSDMFDQPDEIDALRLGNPHMAFGHGIHHCIGAALARVEGEIAINRLIARYPHIALATTHDKLRRRSSVIIRSLTELPVRLTTPAPAA